MKKNYSIVSLVQAFIIIASALLFPVAAHSQDLTAEQKQERCQNNKNRIAELELTLKGIDAELSEIITEKEIQDTRTQMAYVKQMRNNQLLNKDDWAKLDKMGSQYNFNRSNCLETKTWNNCLGELEKIIANKINKAVSRQNKKPGLINEKNEINKQIAVCRNRLIELRCDGNNFDLSGEWICNDGGSYTIAQNGDNITWEGESSDKGKSWAHSFTGKIVDGKIVGSFTDKPSGATKNKGPLIIIITDNNRLDKQGEGSESIFGGSVWTRLKRK